MLVCSWCASADYVAVVGGVPQCRPCRQFSVDSQERAEEILESVIRWLESVFGRGRLRDVRLEYGTIPPEPGSSQLLGHTQLTYSGGVTDLLVETAPSLPEHALGAILAHEFGHVLLFVDDKTMVPNATWPSDDLVAEGFCEVVASQWLESRRDPRSRKLRSRMDTNTTPVYGDGFRAMHPLFLREGSLVRLRESLIDAGTSAGPDPVPVPMPVPQAPTPRGQIPMAPVPSAPTGSGSAPELARHRPVILIDPVSPAPVPAVSGDRSGPTARPVIPMRKPRD